MKKRLFLFIILILAVYVFLSFTITTMTYHGLYVTSEKNELKTILLLKSAPENWHGEGKINETVNEIISAVDYSIRFTVIDIDGNVQYDNWQQDEKLENHLKRPEVSQALKTGTGDNIRYSNIAESDMYYFAVKINDNEIIRLAREISSIGSIFKSTAPILIFLLVILLIIVYIAVNCFMKNILKPVNQLNKTFDEILEGNQASDIKIYDEFKTLSNKIIEQKVKINEYIDELKYERDTIGTITEDMKEGFILINSHKDILSINTSGKRMTGNPKFDLKKNKNILELTRNAEILSRIDMAINENKHLTYDIDTKNSHFRYYFSPVMEQNQLSTAGLLVLIEDVTMQKNAEIMRSEFSANVSHELKTPLTTMIGFAEMIKEGLITDQDSIRKYCGMINDEGLRLISLIEDIMRLSRIEEKTDLDNKKSINLKKSAKNIISLLQSKADGLNVKIYLEAEDVFLDANENYIDELLYNLVDNAIKYNKNGGTAHIIIKKDTDYIHIKVRDTGVGIPEEQQERIFERFYRGDKSHFRGTGEVGEIGGTGLGLSIVKHIAELYHGTIQLKSVQYEGTEIIVKFPII